MAIISSSLLISSLSLFQLTIAYFLHTNPATVTEHGTVLLLGNAFELPNSTSFSTPSHALTLLSCVLSLLSITDLFSANMPAEMSAIYWGSQAPLRCAFFFVLTAWSWLGGPKGLASFSDGTKNAAGRVPGYAPPGFVFGPFSNAPIFAWAFFETLLWFWIYVTLRDERRELSVRAAEKSERERY